jgi:hypothetical protein
MYIFIYEIIIDHVFTVDLYVAYVTANTSYMCLTIGRWTIQLNLAVVTVDAYRGDEQIIGIASGLISAEEMVPQTTAISCNEIASLGSTTRA